MDTLGDMNLFVHVVRTGGLASAGREIGLSPASMSARINRIEEHYGVRLLMRTTRSVTPTEEGIRFYEACQRVLAEVDQAKLQLTSCREGYAGPLRVTATFDLGEQHIVPVLDAFVDKHPDVRPYLFLSDGVVNVVEDGFDVGVRYGVLKDNRLVARKLAKNHRVLCASPDYIKRKGTPQTPKELSDHNCLVMVRGNEPLAIWHFQTDSGPQSLTIHPARSTNNGAQIRRWALAGAGIALKSFWDVRTDIEAGRLVTVLDKFVSDFTLQGMTGNADLHAIYTDRRFLPERTRGFMDALINHFNTLDPSSTATRSKP
ncbi:MAG: LysR family transcriptional regulator [Gammaproteobacteria bacterium]|nr:LysR family transcriptional regulator [Gammaproteobacteria bacterium]